MYTNVEICILLFVCDKCSTSDLNIVRNAECQASNLRSSNGFALLACLRVQFHFGKFQPRMGVMPELWCMCGRNKDKHHRRNKDKLKAWQCGMQFDVTADDSYLILMAVMKSAVYPDVESPTPLVTMSHQHSYCHVKLQQDKVCSSDIAEGKAFLGMSNSTSYRTNA